MKTKTTLLIVGIVLAVLLATASSASAAVISTDKDDYAPEETVQISGTGFSGVVQIDVTRPDANVESGTATAASDGSFVYSYVLDGIVGTYLVEASDGAGNTASTSFTDKETTYKAESYEDAGYATVKNNFEQGDTVYAKGTKTGGDAKLKLDIIDPNGVIVTTKISDHTKEITDSYLLPGDAPTGNWKIKLYQQLGTWQYKTEDTFTVSAGEEPPENEIPEFSTIALPVASILGLLFFFNYRKRRKE
jgi:exosome complex RNA-binding protein Csl4